MKQTDPAQLKRFLLAGKQGTIAAACEELGISRATYYRKIDWIIERVVTATKIEQEKIAAEEAIPVGLVPTILALIDENPAMSDRRIATRLSGSSGRHVSTSTVQKILDGLNLTAREDRIKHVAARLLSGECGLPCEEGQKAISKINPLIIDAPLVRNGDELAIETALIPLPSLLGNDGHLLLFVEIGSLFTFGWFIQKSRDCKKNLDLQGKTEGALKSLTKATRRRRCVLYWKNRAWRKDLSAYSPVSMALDPRLLTMHKLVRHTAAFEHVAHKIRSNWIEPQLAKHNRGSVAEIEKQLQAWLGSYNLTKTEDVFPTMGKFPAVSLGLSSGDTTRFLARSIV